MCARREGPGAHLAVEDDGARARWAPSPLLVTETAWSAAAPRNSLTAPPAPWSSAGGSWGLGGFRANWGEMEEEGGADHGKVG
jgi:hypothetical protein